MWEADMRTDIGAVAPPAPGEMHFIEDDHPIARRQLLFATIEQSTAHPGFYDFRAYETLDQPNGDWLETAVNKPSPWSIKDENGEEIFTAEVFLRLVGFQAPKVVSPWTDSRRLQGRAKPGRGRSKGDDHRRMT
jgi:hypothetical protein